MAIQEFLLPDVGEGLEAGTIVQWFVSPGDTVTVDQIFVEIETDKALVEIPAPVTGTLASHGGKVGASLPVGSVLATFETNTTAAATSSNTTAGDIAVDSITYGPIKLNSETYTGKSCNPKIRPQQPH